MTDPDSTTEALMTPERLAEIRYEATRLLRAKLRLVDAGENAVGESVLELADAYDALAARLEAAETQIKGKDKLLRRWLPPGGEQR